MLTQPGMTLQRRELRKKPEGSGSVAAAAVAFRSYFKPVRSTAAGRPIGDKAERRGAAVTSGAKTAGESQSLPISDGGETPQPQTPRDLLHIQPEKPEMSSRGGGRGHGTKEALDPAQGNKRTRPGGDKEGSPPPGPVPRGLIRHYSMRFCPFAQRSSLVLVAKGIKYEEVNINLKNKPDWFLGKNPLGLVPTLETPDGKIIYESLIVCEYLDEVFPGVKLSPSDPYEKAQQKILIEQFSGVAAVFYKIQYAMNEDTTELRAHFFEKLKTIDAVLAKKKTPYFGGDSVAMADYMIWPWFERFMAFGAADLLEKTSHLQAWHDLMMQNPAVRATYTKPEDIWGFFKLYAADSLEACDYGLH